MHKIIIISASIREGRKSDRVAKYFQSYCERHSVAETEIIDLSELNFPLFTERLKYLVNPAAEVKAFAEKISSAEGIIIVAPEYNGGYPASLKNVIDLLYDEWKRKPVGIAAVSAGTFGGTQMIQQLQFILWKIGAWTVPARFHVSQVNESFTENGRAVDEKRIDKQAETFISELNWCMDRYRPNGEGN